ncbi:MAG: CAP domain-containing protein [Patescibacteria group bacterium]
MVEYRYMRLFRMLHHWFVPHEGNNHRAKALHHDALFAYVLLLAVFNLGIRYFHGAMPDVLGYATDIRIDQLIAATNAKRAEAGLPAVSLNGTLSQAAAAKAADMFANNYWAHNSPAGKTPWDFIIGAGYRYTLAGENLAKNFQTSDGVVEAWMNSPTHRANIVKSGYRDVGFAVVNGVLNGEETTLVVQMFGTTAAAPIAQIPKAEAAGPAPTTAPKVVPQTEEKPVTVVPTEPAAVNTTPAVMPSPALVSGFSFEKFIATPRIDITSLTSSVVFVVVGVLIGILAVDAYIVGKKRVVRLAGHNVAHMLFLLTIVIGGLSIARGSLL